MNDEYINLAYLEAKKSLNTEDVPVGAIIVYKNQIIGVGHNDKVLNKDVFGHAELNAIKEAEKYFNDWRLNESVMYVTLEPCPMCASAIMQSRINKVYIGTSSNNKANTKIINEIFNNPEFNHKVEAIYINDNKCEEIIKNFFQKVRNKD